MTLLLFCILVLFYIWRSWTCFSCTVLHVTCDHRQRFAQLSPLVHESMGVLVAQQKFTISVPRLPNLLFWCLSELNPAPLQPVTKWWAKTLAFQGRCMAASPPAGTRALGTYPDVCFCDCDYSEGNIMHVFADVQFGVADFTCFCVCELFLSFTVHELWSADGEFSVTVFTVAAHFVGVYLVVGSSVPEHTTSST